MNLLRWFRIGVVGMACLGAFALGTGEDRALLVLGGIPLCLASIYLCDTRRYLVFSTTVANVLGVVAMVGMLWNFDRLQQDQQLVALAQLLVALQCILFFRPKNQRLYWMLILLSLLEFQVASIIHSSLLFGALAVAYLGLGAVVLCLFHLITCQQEIGLSPASFWPNPSTTETPTGTGSPSRFSQGRERFSWAVVAHLGWLGLFSLSMAPVLFVLVPRYGHTAITFRPAEGTPGVPVTGFSNQVRLGELGQIVQSSQQVMRIQFLDAATREAYSLEELPLLQGVTLWTYNKGSWSAQGAAHFRLPVLPPIREETGVDLVLADIHLEPVANSTAIFVPPPAYAISERQQPVFYDFVRDAVRRRPEDASREFRCRLLTTAFRQGKLRRFIPAPPLDHDRQSLFLQLPRRGNELQQLQQLALQVTASVDAEDWVKRARVLESFLKESGEFRYTLSPPSRSSEMDPIEDFLLRQRMGHCEYFASALALMLRACGIPSRMIVGFKPQEFNSVGKYYVVRQQDAHTWVQAYIPREKLPPEVANRLPRNVKAAWMLLDPTPGNGEEQVQAGFDWDSLVSFVRMFWTQYIIRMDATRQRQFAEELLSSLMSTGSADGSWLATSGLPMALGLVLLAGVLWMARRRGMRWFALSGEASHNGKTKSHPAVSFLRRLERVLKVRMQQQRRDAQTPQEFAEEVARELALRFGQNGVAEIPRRIVESYYGARFGNRPLSPQETRQMEEWIVRLDRALQNGNGASPEPVE